MREAISGSTVNLFVLDEDPKKAARALGDKHINKMLIETVQLICNAFPAEMAPYKRTHYNHPASRWVRATRGNLVWAIEYAAELGVEWQRRFPTSKAHASSSVLTWCALALGQIMDQIPAGARTPFVQIMPKRYRGADPVQAYRRYYLTDKAHLAYWQRGREAPAWAKGT